LFSGDDLLLIEFVRREADGEMPGLSMLRRTPCPCSFLKLGETWWVVNLEDF